MEPQGDKKIPDFFANRTQIQSETEEESSLSEEKEFDFNHLEDDEIDD